MNFETEKALIIGALVIIMICAAYFFYNKSNKKKENLIAHTMSSGASEPFESFDKEEKERQRWFEWVKTNTAPTYSQFKKKFPSSNPVEYERAVGSKLAGCNLAPQF